MRNWTDDQRAAIDVRGGSVLVSAAAGSGKTAVLVERVIRLICDRENPVDADRLLIVTFTNAAAGEMRERIATSLDEQLSLHPEDAYLQRQKLLLAKAQISTIHSFCLNLLRSNFHLLGLSPDFRIADETELSLMRANVLDEALEQFYGEGDEGFLRLVEFVSGKDDRPLRELVFAIYDFIRSAPAPKRWLSDALEKLSAADMSASPWGYVLFNYAEDALAYADQQLRYAIHLMQGDEAMEAAYLPAYRDDLSLVSRLSQLCANRDWDRMVSALRTLTFQKLGALRKYEDTAKKDRVNGLRKEVKDILGDLAKKQFCTTNDEFTEDMKVLQPIISALFRLVEDFYDRLDEAKAEHNLVDFADLEQFVLRILTDSEGHPTPLAKELSGQFDEILIDEYQDTNAAQDTIFTLISQKGENLFMVGDVKQSIYRFRQARPDLFLARRRTYHPYGDGFPAQISLAKNFRSRQEVVDAVNAVFSRLMSERVGEVCYDAREALYTGAVYPPSDGAKAELHLVPVGEEDEDKTTVEAEHVAAQIEQMLRQRYPVREGDAMRPCRCRDFCILLRSVKGKAEVYVNALKSRGINVWSDVTTGYFDSREISVLFNLLRIIDNPMQDIPLLSVLLSPMFGFTPDEVTAIRLLDRNAAFYLALRRQAESGDVKCRAFLETLSGLRADSAVMPVDRLIQRIYDRTDFLAMVGAMQSGEQRQANLRLLLDYARRYEGTGHGGLGGFIRYIDRAVEKGQDFASANTLSENADVVRIMSIHRAKGLEFPICIVADCGKRFNKEDLRGSYLMHADLGFTMKIRDAERLRTYPTAAHESIRLQLEQEMLSEEMRVLYVAMTRAKEKLILTMASKQPEKMLLAAQESAGEESLSAYAVRKANSYGEWLLLSIADQLPKAAELTQMLSNVGDAGQLDESRHRVENILSLDGALILRYTPADAAQVNDDHPLLMQSEPDADLMNKLHTTLAFQYRYASLSEVPAKLAVTQISEKAAGEKVSLRTRPEFLTEHRMTGAERGQILHRFMQFADYSLASRDLSAEIDRLVREGYFLPYEAEALSRKRLTAFFDSQLAARILSADRAIREFRFFDERSAIELYPNLASEFADEKILVQGVADCVLMESDGLVLIDYKTDFADSPEALADRYRTQLFLYSRALEKSFLQPVKERILYAFHFDRPIAVDLPE